MLVARAFARALAEYGHTVLFGLMGNTNMALITSFMEQDGCRYIAVANESAAVTMASGYAQVSGTVGVATVIKGPGLTNTMTALSDAARANSPIVVIAADKATSVRGKDDLQYVPQRDFVIPTGAGFEQVRTPQTALLDLWEARRRAIAESRPIVLNVPTDFTDTEIDYESPLPYQATVGRTLPNPDELDVALGVIANARRPLILAGRGAATPGSREAILRLSKRLGAPLATTLRGKDLFRGEPGNLGIFGTLASDRASQAIAEADCVITFGSSLNYRTTDTGQLLRGKAIVQCDTNRSIIGQGATIQAAVVGDAGAVADAMASYLDEMETTPTSFLSSVETAPAAWTAPARAARIPDTVDFLDALRVVEESVPDNRVLTVDNGRFMYSAYKWFRVPEPLSYVHTASVGSIGLGLGHAIGAALAAPGRPTLLVTGDGGFMNGGVAELRTAVNAGVDLIVVIMNDSAFGAEHRRMVAHGVDPTPSTFSWPNFADVGVALGTQGLSVTDEASLNKIPEVIADRSGVLVIDIRLDPSAIVTGSTPAAPGT
jgi:acetolactate synthase I/II/III large subunit